jgi:hypothetical protein
MATSSKNSARDALSLALESQPDMIKEVKHAEKYLRALAHTERARRAQRKDCATVRKDIVMNIINSSHRIPRRSQGQPSILHFTFTFNLHYR